MPVVERSELGSRERVGRTGRLPRHAWLVALGAGTLAMLGCGTDIAPARPLAPTDASQMYWSLSLSHHAITLATVAPYDTIRLTATPLNAYGAALPVAGTLTFSSSDRHTVQVDSTGLVRAIAGGANIHVIATLAEGNLIHVDTALINVTSDTAPAPITTFSIHPSASDTVVLAEGLQFFGGAASLSVRATDASGNAVTGIALEVTSSDTSIAKVCGVSSVQVRLCASQSNGSGRPGKGQIIASTTTYGITVADTVPVRVTPPVFTWLYIRPVVQRVGGPAVASFVPGPVTVAPGATVLWLNATLFDGSGQPVDVTFEDSSAVAAPDTTDFVDCRILGFPTAGGGSGNIPAFGDTSTTTLTDGMCRARRFPEPGVYPYHSVITGATGTVVVTDGS